ncbi:hypothetical protein J2S09_002403 [Bacillus fengqiuensis]|nr:hypothetical protein [Bacillus fengqiuensis]
MGKENKEVEKKNKESVKKDEKWETLYRLLKEKLKK